MFLIGKLCIRREYYLTNAIQIYLDKIFDAIEHESFDTSILYEFA